MEPHDGMRAELEKKQLKGVKVFAGMANDMEEIKSQCMDGVVAAQVCLPNSWTICLDGGSTRCLQIVG